jgi:hypothetical protein
VRRCTSTPANHHHVFQLLAVRGQVMLMVDCSRHGLRREAYVAEAQRDLALVGSVRL